MNKKKLTRAFIVDDSHDAVELLRRMLESNYSVEVVGTAFDAEEAAAKIVNTDPDLIFLDVELPTMSMIRNELKPETKVVFYTGHDKYMLEAIRRQAFDYLLKPPTEQELSQIMTRYYENKLTGIPQSAHAENHLPLILVVNALNEHLHKRYIVNVNNIKKIQDAVCILNEPLDNNRELKISKNFKQELLSAFYSM